MAKREVVETGLSIALMLWVGPRKRAITRIAPAGDTEIADVFLLIFMV